MLIHLETNTYSLLASSERQNYRDLFLPLPIGRNMAFSAGGSKTNLQAQQAYGAHRARGLLMNYKILITRRASVRSGQTQFVLVVVAQLSEQKRVTLNLVHHTVLFIDAA